MRFLILEKVECYSALTSVGPTQMALYKWRYTNNALPTGM